MRKKDSAGSEHARSLRLDVLYHRLSQAPIECLAQHIAVVRCDLDLRNIYNICSHVVDAKSVKSAFAGSFK